MIGVRQVLEEPKRDWIGNWIMQSAQPSVGMRFDWLFVARQWDTRRAYGLEWMEDLWPERRSSSAVNQHVIDLVQEAVMRLKIAFSKVRLRFPGGPRTRAQQQ